MQSQVHGYARWSVAQRIAGSPTDSVIDAAFDEGSILRTHVLRPTWHYVAAEDLGWLMRLSGPRVDAGNASMYRTLGLDSATFERSNDVIARCVEAGPRTRKELFAMLDAHGLSTPNNRGVHMLMHAELTSVIRSGPMRGKQHTYAAFDQRSSVSNGPEGDEALAVLAWRYFSTRGPATVKDFAWWSGLNMPSARRGLELANSRLESWEVDGRTYWFVDQDVPPANRQAVDLVQCYDEMIVSYSESRDVLQRSEMSFPVPRYIDGYQHVALLEGRLLGHWRVTPGGSVETRISVQLDADRQSALDRAIERYQRFAEV